MKLSRKISIVLGILYIVIITGATVYCQRTYYSNLPTAYLAKPATEQIVYSGKIPNIFKDVKDNMYPNAIPRTCLSPESTGKMKVNMIAEEDGPWGKRYKIKQTDAVYWPVDSNSKYIVIFWRMDDSLPIAADVDNGFAYEGMEVGLQLKK